jgi:hypothetical protein
MGEGDEIPVKKVRNMNNPEFNIRGFPIQGQIFDLSPYPLSGEKSSSQMGISRKGGKDSEK